MNETVTIDAAISKGHKIVTCPGILVMFGTMGLAIYLGVQEIIPTRGIPVGIALSFLFAWLWWSFMITKWRLWAFDHVRNVHELKKRAVQENLIGSDNSIFEKTEIRTAYDKEKLSLLQDKFKLDDLFQDDLTVANETVIYYSKSKNFAEMAVMSGCSGIGLFLLLKSERYIWGSALSIVFAYLGFKEYKEATNKEPQIILNDKGIKTISTDFYNWSDIENEEVVSEGSGKHIHYYLTYNYPDGVEHLQIDDYDTNQRSLNKLLILYRGRSKKTTTARK